MPSTAATAFPADLIAHSKNLADCQLELSSGCGTEAKKPTGDCVDDVSKQAVDAVMRIQSVPLILDVISRVSGMGFAAVARVTEDRWIACSVLDSISFGLSPGGELDVKTTICEEIRLHSNPVVIDDVLTDPVYCQHHTPQKYGFRSYISMPIYLQDGSFFGTLCAIDPKPNKPSRREVLGMFQLFAKMIGAALDAELRFARSEQYRLDQEEIHRLRDQFIAVLGHDLRNPLASIDAGTRALSRHPLDDKAITVVALMQRSVRRMSELIDNVLDFARGRLGEGITIRRSINVPLGPELEQVISELRSFSDGQPILAELNISEPVVCDPSRICQLLSNLVGNAMHHGKPRGVIRIQAETRGKLFEMWVANEGKPISDALLPYLFQPFTRPAEGSKQGLGLGLYICAEIARAHDGSINVKSSPEGTVFTFQMPRG